MVEKDNIIDTDDKFRKLTGITWGKDFTVKSRP